MRHAGSYHEPLFFTTESGKIFQWFLTRVCTVTNLPILKMKELVTFLVPFLLIILILFGRLPAHFKIFRFYFLMFSDTLFLPIFQFETIKQD